MGIMSSTAGLGAAAGSVVPGIGTVAGGIGGALLGLIPGLFSSKGEKAPDLLSGNQGVQGLNSEAGAQMDGKLQAALKQYAQDGDLGKLQAADTSGQLSRMAAMDPRTGSQMATQQVQDNPLLSGMFGKGGMQDRMNDQEKDLSSRGFTLQPEDYEAYGQASDNTARLFGQEEGSLAQALASRGLAAGASGAAGSAYSGLMGNKNERLAASQLKIAQDRMEMNRQRLNDVRGELSDANKQAEGAINDQYTRNANGITQHQNVLKDSMNAGVEQQNAADNRFNQDQDTRGPSIGQALLGGAGMLGGYSLGGKQGAAIGGMIGNNLGGAISRRS